MNLRDIDQPEEVLTLEEVRRHLRINSEESPFETPDDAWITDNIPVARQHAEDYTSRRIGARTMELRVNAFSDPIQLPALPVHSVTHISYIDDDGAEQLLDEQVYEFDDDPQAPAVRLGWQKQWPSTRPVVNAVRVRFRAGYTSGDSPDPAPLPAPLRHAMLLMIGHWYENREEAMTVATHQIPMGATHLMQGYRLNAGL